MNENPLPVEEPIVLVGETSERDDDCACPDGAVILTSEAASLELENDCACPDRPFALAEISESGQTYVKTPDTFLADLPHEFKLALSPYAPAGPSVLNSIAWSRWQAFEMAQPLKEQVDITFAGQRLVQPQGAKFATRDSDPQTLTAWLHITNACNLDCPYCYVRKSSAYMSDAIGIQSIQRIFQSAQENGFRSVKLKYAGGEATLHFKLIRRLHEHAARFSRETGIKLREVILSNGTHFRPDDADWIKQAGLKLMISLDGIGEMHDRLRPRIGGGGSFDAVQRTVDQVLLPRGICPDITITVTRINAPGVSDAVRWALERDLPVSLNFYRQNILSASHHDLDLEEQTIITGMLEAYAVFEEYLPTRPFFNGLLDRVQAEAHSHTCGVGIAYLVISHEGKLAQCQMHLSNPISNTLEGRLLPLVAIGPIQNISVEQKSGCRDCSYRYRCAGGCALETYRATGRWDVSSPNCRIYKALLPAAYRLEGLRLLKRSGYIN